MIGCPELLERFHLDLPDPLARKPNPPSPGESATATFIAGIDLDGALRWRLLMLAPGCAVHLVR